MKRTLLAAVLLATVLLATAVLPASPVAAQSCDEPTVNTLISAEAAISRPQINSPGELPVSSIYSLLSQATKPKFVYTEAGPQYTGVLEALASNAPEPPRAVSAYPSLDIPDDDTEDWGGKSITSVTAVSGLATSAGQSLGVEGPTAKSSRSWVSSIVECDTVTVIAGWEANNVVIAPGSTVEQMGQVATLVVGPDGSSADIETTVVGAEGFSEVPADGRPADPVMDPFTENGAPRMEVGEPRTSADDNSASAAGGGFYFLFLDPEAGQGAGYRIGSIIAQIDILGALEPATLGAVAERPSTTTTTANAAPVAPLPAAPPPQQRPQATSVSGTPPEPSPIAIAAVEEIALSTSLTDVTVDSRTWVPVIVFLGSLLLFAQITAVIRIGRRWDPTLDWIVRHGDRAASRFANVYLKW